MTAKSANKSSARNLAALTGMTYQSCLTTVQVLQNLPAGMTLADLEPVITGSGSGQVVLNLPGGHEVNYRGVLPLAFGSGGGDAEVIVVAQAEPALAVRACGPDWEPLVGGASLWFELGLREDLLRPAGVWRTTAKRLLGAVESGAGKAAAVLTDPAEDMEAMVDVLGGSIPDVAYIGRGLSTAAASYTTAGPGFDWAHFTFADLEQVYGPDEQDHRLSECHDGNCGYLHDWPTANPAHTQIAMPAPLVDAYQRIMALAGPDPDGFDNEMSFNHGVTKDGSHWYGLETYFWHSDDLKDLCGVWMRVDPSAAEGVNFPAAVG